MLAEPDSAGLGADQSACSSDTGDVLVRSTRVLLSDRRPGPGPEPEPGPGSVHITVQKLRDPPQTEQQTRTQSQTRTQGQTRTQSQTQNRTHQGQTRIQGQPRGSGRQSPDRGAALRAAESVTCSGRHTVKKQTTKENREPRGRPPAVESSPRRKLSAGTHGDRRPGQDVVTSRFAAGGRGVVLAALKHRSHSAPHRREVRVQLLDPAPLKTRSQDDPGLRTSSQHAVRVAGVQREGGNSSGHQRDETDTPAPLIQSHLEAQVSHLAEGVHKLLQADRGGVDRGRSLTQQTLHHLETLHSQQLQLQGQLLESALRIVMGHAPPADLTASGRPARLQVTHLDAAADVLSRQQSASSAVVTGEEAVETGQVAMATTHHDQQPEETRDGRRRQGAPSVSTATHPAAGSHLRSSANHSEAAAKRANEMLKEMGRLKTEMKTLLKPEDSLKTSTPGSDLHHSHQNLLQSQQTQSCQSRSQQTEPQSPQNHQTRTRPVPVRRRPPAPSALEEAGRVLRQVQRQKKVLEENLEALLRVQTGEVLHGQLEALAANREWTEEVRIKKTVDAWIDTLTKDIQAETTSDGSVTRRSARRDAAVTSQPRAAGSSAHAGRGGPVSALRGQTAGHRALQGAEPDGPSGVVTDSESYLTRLYGRAPYDGLRRTLKKSPYLRLSSAASPLGRKPRPRLVESVRGVKVKSCKTQTCPAPPLSPSPGRPQRRDIISSSHLTSADPAVTPEDRYSVPMAIPLGRPRIDSSRCLAERQQEVTSPAGSALESQETEQLDAGEAPPAPPAPPPPVDIMEMKSEEEEDETDVFPGTHFLSVADVVQQEELSAVEEEEEEEALELDGGPSPPPVLYQGPVFPPQAPSALPAQDQASVRDQNQQRDALETRLVDWVEQQLMSRMISEMYRPPPSDPAQNHSTDQSESEEQSVTSDIVEAAGGGGLQLFVDSSVSVDSALIRRLVDEVLTEHVALMLGRRDALGAGPEPGLEPPKPGPGAPQEERPVPLVSTPVLTPQPSPTPPSRESPPLTTPPPSEPTSLLNEEAPQPITAQEPVATPTSSPEPTHSAGGPPAVHQAPPPLTWEDTELPLDEERPEEQLDAHTQPLVMSVAEEEPPLSSPLPPAPSPSPPRPTGPEPRPASPCSSSDDSSSSRTSRTSRTSSSGSSSVVTEAALKHISEGELLISVNQLAAMTEEEAVCSFSSSLQELQEMDFDPPSEGQVRGHELLLTLLTKMERGVTHRGERPQPEGSWGEGPEEEVSVGEVRDERTTNPKRLSRTTAAGRGQTSSPGQISQCAEVSEVSFEATNQGSVTISDLMMEPVGALTNLSLSPPPPHTAGQVSPLLIRQFDTQTAESRRMNVHLPSIRPEEEEEEQREEEEEEEEQREEEQREEEEAGTHSSTSDVF